MEREQLIAELKHILIRAIFLDISAYLISVFFAGFTISMATGLILGTLGLIVNLILLNRSVRNIVKSGGAKARQSMLGGYVIRFAIVGLIIAATMMIPFINVIGVVIPYFYPHLIYAGKVFLKKGE